MLNTPQVSAQWPARNIQAKLLPSRSPTEQQVGPPAQHPRMTMFSPEISLEERLLKTIPLCHISKSLQPSTTVKEAYPNSLLKYVICPNLEYSHAHMLQITCLFWFESSYILHEVEESVTAPLPSTPLVPEAMPSMGFRKWVTTILSTTQVTQNVILLALMFIYRLKRLNPGVKGKLGSEFRLLTVALMLGNKCVFDY